MTSVDPYDAGPEGRLHLVRIEYTDGEVPPEDTVIWEREHPKKLLVSVGWKKHNVLYIRGKEVEI